MAPLMIRRGGGELIDIGQSNTDPRIRDQPCPQVLVPALRNPMLVDQASEAPSSHVCFLNSGCFIAFLYFSVGEFLPSFCARTPPCTRTERECLTLSHVTKWMLAPVHTRWARSVHKCPIKSSKHKLDKLRKVFHIKEASL